MLYAVAIATHIVVAVLGIGLVGAVPLVARWTRGTGGSADTRNLLAVLLRSTQLAFAAMVVTGILLDVSVAGAFHRAGWFQLSVVVLAFVGFSHARARVALRSAPSVAVPDLALRGVERWGVAMCVGIAALALLMQLKPFPGGLFP
jgi:hypothetical protein